jgi:hypothetical protein
MIFDPEDGGGTFLRNTGQRAENTTLQPGQEMPTFTTDVSRVAVMMQRIVLRFCDVASKHYSSLLSDCNAYVPKCASGAKGASGVLCGAACQTLQN